jgi:predicted secreted protein
MKVTAIKEKLVDDRNMEITFVSHCLLNENTRYIGGAFCYGVNENVVMELLKSKTGIVQMVCPEQIVWGGIEKKYLWIPIGVKLKLKKYLLRFIYPVFIFYSKCRYWLIAKRVVREICDYIKSGYTIKRIIGIDGSPTCGVNNTLDMYKSLKYFEDIDVSMLTRKTFNDDMYRTCCVNENGLFISVLKKLLNKKGVIIDVGSIDLAEEKESLCVKIK